ncbi:putative toxin-antitoxin system toxin component, PIN family [Sulfuricystis multivorans]|uniref:putative toxin-antitoxin system toxin component, PIN family n=1 Tax=Sulfuricystis multivorans TaxID=2211108 RepID=UPI000F81A2D8|nr:putative toxin-antitoxin system toxin component, PIN family [Sulfuricystis multivorans]
MSTAIRVVFDTNVLISIFVFADSRLATLWGEVVSGRWVALTNAPCLAEFKRVLGYPLFALATAAQEAAYTAYLAQAESVDAVPQKAAPLPRCRDQDDQKFLELARDGQAQWLVTADKLLLKLKRRQRLRGLFSILTPEEALQKVGAIDTARSSK